MEERSCGGVKTVNSNKIIIDELKKELEGVKSNEVNYFVFSYNRSRKINAYKTRINEEIGKTVLNGISNCIQSLDPSHLYNYEDSDSADNEYPELIESKEVPRSAEIIKAINETENMLKQKDLEKLSSPKFAIKAGNIVGFDSITKRNFMDKKKKFMFLNDESIFDKIKQEVFLEIPESFSALYFKDHIVILREPIFESIFGFHEKMVKSLEDKEELVGNLISDSDNFKTSIQKDYKKLRKIYNVFNSNYIKNLTVEAIHEIANYFNLDIHFNEENKKIDFSQSDPWQVINALSEDYFKGWFSDSNFESHSKRKMN